MYSFFTILLAHYRCYCLLTGNIFLKRLNTNSCNNHLVTIFNISYVFIVYRQITCHETRAKDSYIQTTPVTCAWFVLRLDASTNTVITTLARLCARYLTLYPAHLILPPPPLIIIFKRMVFCSNHNLNYESRLQLKASWINCQIQLSWISNYVHLNCREKKRLNIWLRQASQHLKNSKLCKSWLNAVCKILLWL